jgi:Spy/CpxP family protein refolding chaperone
MPMRAMSQLELSNEQRAQIKNLFRDQRDAMRDTMDKMQDNRESLRDAAQNGADEKKVRTLAEKQGDLVTEMIMARTQMRKKINDVLTEEQRTELQKIRKQRMNDPRDRDDDDERGRW